MHRAIALLLAVFFLAAFVEPAQSQESADAVAQALAQGDAFLSHKNFDKARQAYLKADKLSHHTCGECFLRMLRADRQAGDLSAALDDAKRAAKAAGDDKVLAARAHMARGVLLAQMSGKPSDKKLREAVDELHQALELDPGQAMAHFNLGEILIQQERDDDGILELKNYIAAPGADPKMVSEARRIIANPILAREPFAPDFSFATPEGETIANAALRGKVVLLDFWGTWCPPCRESVPMLADIRKKFLNRPFQIIGISSDEDEQAWKSFIAAHHMDWSEYRDNSGQVQELFKINAFPTFIVLDRDGVIRFRQSGLSAGLSQEELEEAINKALKRPSQFSGTAPPSAPAAEESRASAGQQSAPTTIGLKPAAAASETVPSASPAEATEVEGGSISGNTYENDSLSFSYEFPPGWVAAKPQTLHAANETTAASTKAMALQQHPELGASLRLMVPKTIFYASRSGEDDGQRLAIPCVRITVMRWNGPVLTVGSVKGDAERMNPPGMNPVGEPEEYAAGDRDFFRTDFEYTRISPHTWLSRFQGVVNGYLLTLEFLAANKQELEQLVSTAESLSFH